MKKLITAIAIILAAAALFAACKTAPTPGDVGNLKPDPATELDLSDMNGIYYRDYGDDETEDDDAVFDGDETEEADDYFEDDDLEDFLEDETE